MENTKQIVKEALEARNYDITDIDLLNDQVTIYIEQIELDILVGFDYEYTQSKEAWGIDTDIESIEVHSINLIDENEDLIDYDDLVDSFDADELILPILNNI